jgi:hypothetical protein
MRCSNSPCVSHDEFVRDVRGIGIELYMLDRRYYVMYDVEDV